MAEIIKLIPVLAVAIFMNICAGLYYNIGTKKLSFQLNILMVGILKALLTSGLFLGTAYCFDAIDLSSLGVTPLLVMNSAVTIYAGKAMISLGKILGVDVAVKS